MTAIAIYVLILIIQIITLIKYRDENTKKTWNDLLYIELSSFILVISFFVYSYFIRKTFLEESKLLIKSSIVAILIYIGILLLSINIKNKNREIKAEEKYIKSIIKSIFKIALIPLLIIAFIFLEHIPNHLNYVENKRVLNELKKDILTHLKERYGDGNFKIIKIEKLNSNINYNKNLLSDYALMLSYNYKITISTKYIKENFEILINSNYKDYKKDNFLEKYLIENDKMQERDTLEDYLEEQISFPLRSYDAYIETEDLILYESFYNEKYGKIPTVEQLLKSTSFKTGNVIIERKFTKEEETSFQEYIMELIKVYLKYYVSDYSSQKDIIFRFYFTYANPFATNDFYSDGGYVRISSNTILIYNKPTPIEVEFNKILLFEITSTKLNCPCVYLKVYEDNIYEYIDNTDGFSTLGAYDFDIKKILDSIKNASDESISSYTIMTPTEKYSIGENKELEKFLNSININLHQCLN